MSTPTLPALQTFMVVATFRADTDVAALRAVLPDEERQIALLRSEGRLGAVHVSLARMTAFAEILAADEEHAVETARTLPLSAFCDMDVYPTPPPGPDGPGR